jgi:hypothetical protein
MTMPSRLATALAACMVLATGMAGAAGAVVAGRPSSAASQVSLTVVGIGRDGNRAVLLSDVVTATSGGPWVMAGPHGHVAPGRYLVSGVVSSSDPGGPSPVLTMIVRAVTVRRAMTVRLDARGGVPLKISLNAPGAEQVDQSASIWNRRGAAPLAEVSGDPPGTTFVTPSSLRNLCLSYYSHWQGPSGQLYELAGARSGPISSSPSFQVSAATLATVRISVRAGTSGGAGSLLLQHDNCAPAADTLAVTTPSATIEYLSPGKWSARLEIFRGQDNLGGRLVSGKSYAWTFGNAVVGPAGSAGSYPFVSGDRVTFSPSEIFSYPGALFISSLCCAKTAVTLRSGSRVVRRATVREGGAQFAATARKGGWYELSADSVRSGDGPEPPGLLSPRVTLSFRFRAGPGTRNGFAPVTLVTYVPSGLDLNNDAAPGASTPVRLTISRAGSHSLPAMPGYRLRSVQLDVSYDGGTTWQQVKLMPGKAAWTALIADPASGYVSLRSTVADVHGDRTVETIYRAYGIS